MRLYGRYIFIAFSSLFVLLLALHAGASSVQGRSVERVLAGLRAKGEPLTLSEVAPPPVPDEQNAALVYQRAFQTYPKSGDDRSVSTVSDFISDKPTSARLATTGQVREILANAAPALDLVRQAAAMPECRFSVDYEAGAGATFPHLASIRQTARLLSARSLVEAMDGRSSESLADVGAILDMSRQISSEPILISQLVQYACLAIAGRALQRSMALAAPDAEASAGIYRKLAAYDVSGSFTRALKGERAFGLWTFNLAARDPQAAASLLSMSEPEGAPGGAHLASSGPATPTGLALKQDEIRYLDAMQGAIDQAQGGKPSTGIDRAKRTADSIPPSAVLTRAMLPALDRAVQKRDEAAARLGLAEWALALNATSQRTGRYPSSLAEAQSLTGWTLPNDSFAGKPFRYHAQPGGFALYSVGPNGKDDGGVQEKQSARPSTAQPARDDVAWTVPEDLQRDRPQPPHNPQ